MTHDTVQPVLNNNEQVDERPESCQDSSCIIRELGELPPGAIITEEGLAKIFGRHQVSIKRAVQRGELPPSVRLFGVQVWTVAAIQQHLKNRLETALKESEQNTTKFMKLRP
jgi:hypothetical protein